MHLYDAQQDLKEIIAEGTKKLASFGGGGGGGGGGAAAGGGGGDAGAAAAAPKVEEKEEEEEVDMGGGMDIAASSGSRFHTFRISVMDKTHCYLSNAVRLRLYGSDYVCM
eukprot:6048-Heterococcus_DN1.PRE.2